MPDELPVDVNRRERNSLNVPASIETDDSFVVRVRNHGNASRVHVHLDENLSAVASLDETNHYVEANSRRDIPVSVHEHGVVHGKIKLSAGYGATTRWVDVKLTEPDDTGSVEVDESLAEPGGGEREPTDEESDGAASGSMLADRPALPVLALGALAVAVAIGAATVFESGVVAAGAAVVFVAVLLAGYLLVR
ncbi:hypothetical protein SAMN05216388_100683 [Halorientalis persicus]|uniref:Uncharacterized protein n=1 Tax=Halorientalis persicus TaxID=1367881 RepID=A0A1H8KJK9_9EURY|nr:hypothetical protein [Halorientalis persicus]SEN93074.1 hypothetical protein SAMN05216388_100683 [Halorientalis persicus]